MVEIGGGGLNRPLIRDDRRALTFILVSELHDGEQSLQLDVYLL